jgi:pimeloyl-ACP methyl ester carboxylesterase
MITRISAAALFVLLVLATPASASSTCDTDGTQLSGSIYRICMPAPADYNGMLVIWSHGFQDAGTPVAIPEDQLCIGTFCIPEIINSLGFGFATNSYSKTGTAILQGKDDILDLVNIYATQQGAPSKVYLVGASEGGIITALSLEQHPDVYSAGLAACGPIGNFPLQINYFGDARATFDVFFPGIVPGPAFDPPQALVDVWNDYFELVVKPIVMAPQNRDRLNQWVAVAHLPFDAGNFEETVVQSVRDVLRYSVINLHDAAQTIGGFPYGNATRVYRGSSNDFLLNLLVPRVTADPIALNAMNTDYATTGVLQRPLVTLHTLRDQQVPYVHEQLYALKTLASGSFLTKMFPIAIDRFEHCNFTPDEVLASFAVMLIYDGAIENISGVGAVLTPGQLAAFDRLAKATGLPYRRDGQFSITLRRP